MGQHADYGKRLLRAVAQNDFAEDREVTKVEYAGGTLAFIDGVIKDSCAVEIESRVDKQIRGALVDLLFHPFPKKLLILIPAHMNNPRKTEEQCEDILNKLKRPFDKVKVVVLQGTGDNPMDEADKALLKLALSDLDIF